jgi:hypothetical protein
MTLSRRIGVFATILTLCVGHLALCVGWQATPEARMACCTSGTSCPMHKAASHGSGSNRSITQVQADNCCAATSNRTQSSVASTTFALSSATARQPIIGAVVPVPVLALQEWRALVPLPLSPVPKHLLLSVLLV